MLFLKLFLLSLLTLACRLLFLYLSFYKRRSWLWKLSSWYLGAFYCEGWYFGMVFMSILNATVLLIWIIFIISLYEYRSHYMNVEMRYKYYKEAIKTQMVIEKTYIILFSSISRLMLIEMDFSCSFSNGLSFRLSINPKSIDLGISSCFYFYISIIDP